MKAKVSPLPASFFCLILFLLSSTDSLGQQVVSGQYAFAPINVPGAACTHPVGINNSGQIVGYFSHDIYCVGSYHGFLKDGNSFTTIDVPGATNTVATGINSSGQIVGSFWGNGDERHGFLKDGNTFTTIDFPGVTFTEARGINETGQVVGYSNESSFLKDGNVFTAIKFPGMTLTMAEGINSSGQIAGVVHSGERPYGFIKDDNSFTAIDVPGAKDLTEVYGINDSGQVVGRFWDASDCHGFLKDGNSFTTIDVPGAAYTQAFGINRSGQIVGNFADSISSRNIHGFLATPTICHVPGKPTLISPSGNTNVLPTYSWNAASDAEQYLLWVNNAGKNGRIQKWFTAAAAGCPSGTGTCSATPSVMLDVGAGTWWLQAWNSCEGGSYGPWSDGMTFTVATSEPPGKATLISPSGSISTSTPAYGWNAVSGSTWYYLWVKDSASNPKIQKWFTADQAGCASSTATCSVTSPAVLAQGVGQWWIQTWNNAGYGPWSDPMSFQVTGNLPGATTLVAPTGTISTKSPTYTWNVVPNATWYYLWVSDSTGTKITTWYTAAQAGCGAGSSCSVTPTTILGVGQYQWWIQTWNDAGYGPWSDGMTFTVP